MMNTLAGVSVPGGRHQHGEHLRQRLGGQQHRPVAGHRGHRRKHVHALCPGDPRQQFQGEERHAASGQFGGRFRTAQRVALADHHLALAVKFQVLAAGLGVGAGGADLQENIARKYLGAGFGDFRPFVNILLIAVARRLAGPSFNQHLQPGLDQLGGRSRNQSDSPFAGVTFTRNCNNHGLPIPSSFRGGKSRNHNKHNRCCK